jgi:transposase
MVHAVLSSQHGPAVGYTEDRTLSAAAQIQAKSSRAIKPPLDPDLYAERHKMENFFQRIIRFRRIALRCGKTLTSFMGFVFLVSALDWLG